MADHDRPSVFLKDGCVVIQRVEFDEFAEEPSRHGDGFGEIRRSDRRHRFEFLELLGVDDEGRTTLNTNLNDLSFGLQNVTYRAAPLAYQLLCSHVLTKKSVWHKKPDALLAILRLGGDGREPDGSNRVTSAIERLQERLGSIAEEGDAYTRSDRLDRAIWRAACLHRSRSLSSPGELTRDAVLLTCRAVDTNYENSWQPTTHALSVGALDELDAVHGLWLPDRALQLELDSCETEVKRRKQALAFARQLCDLYSSYIEGDVYQFKVDVFPPKRDDETSEVILNCSDYESEAPLASRAVGSFYGDNDALSGLDECLKDCTAETLHEALAATARPKIKSRVHVPRNTPISSALQFASA